MPRVYVSRDFLCQRFLIPAGRSSDKLVGKYFGNNRDSGDKSRQPPFHDCATDTSAAEEKLYPLMRSQEFF